MEQSCFIGVDIDVAKGFGAMSPYESPTVTEKKNGFGEWDAVVQAYLNLVAYIATHRDGRTIFPGRK